MIEELKKNKRKGHLHAVLAYPVSGDSGAEVKCEDSQSIPDAIKFLELLRKDHSHRFAPMSVLDILKEAKRENAVYGHVSDVAIVATTSEFNVEKSKKPPQGTGHKAAQKPPEMNDFKEFGEAYGSHIITITNTRKKIRPLTIPRKCVV